MTLVFFSKDTIWESLFQTFDLIKSFLVDLSINIPKIYNKPMFVFNQVESGSHQIHDNKPTLIIRFYLNLDALSGN